MSISHDMTDQFALDMQGFQRMQHTARTDPEEGVKGAAQQFEAMFVQMMVKSMRETIPDSGLMDSKALDSYQSMMDKQWSQVVASRGVGLADALVDQLEKRGALGPDSPDARSESGSASDSSLIAGIPHGTPRELDNSPSTARASDRQAPNRAGPAGSAGNTFFNELEAVRQTPEERETSRIPTDSSSPAHVQQFMQALEAPAQAASDTTGVPSRLILAQAALETGWGRHEIATDDGRNSHNLFGIKAGSRWQGETTDVTTHEYIDGRRIEKVDSFRVYDSFEHALTDYGNLVGNNPRYSGVVNAPDARRAAVALQQGGYATDPRYAAKLIDVMDSMEDPAADTLAKAR